MFLDGDRIVGAAFDRRIVRHDHHFASRDAADAGHEPRSGRGIVVHAEGRERRQFEEWRLRIEQPIDSLANRQFPLRSVAFEVPGTSTVARRCHPLFQFSDEALHAVRVQPKLG